MTFSIGFRAPSRREFLSAFLAAAADAPGGPDPRFGDRGRRPERHPGAIPDDLHRRLGDWARGWRPDRAALDRFIGEFLTEPKPDVWFDPPAARLAPARLAAATRRRGLRLDRRTRMVWRGAMVFANGQGFDVPAAQRRSLRRLADRRALSPVDCSRAFADPELAAMLADWFDAGWLHLGPVSEPPTA